MCILSIQRVEVYSKFPHVLGLMDVVYSIVAKPHLLVGERVLGDSSQDISTLPLVLHFLNGIHLEQTKIFSHFFRLSLSSDSLTRHRGIIDTAKTSSRRESGGEDNTFQALKVLRTTVHRYSFHSKANPP